MVGWDESGFWDTMISAWFGDMCARFTDGMFYLYGTMDKYSMAKITIPRAIKGLCLDARGVTDHHLDAIVDIIRMAPLESLGIRGARFTDCRVLVWAISEHPTTNLLDFEGTTMDRQSALRLASVLGDTPSIGYANVVVCMDEDVADAFRMAYLINHRLEYISLPSKTQWIRLPGQFRAGLVRECCELVMHARLWVSLCRQRGFPRDVAVELLRARHPVRSTAELVRVVARSGPAYRPRLVDLVRDNVDRRSLVCE